MEQRTKRDSTIIGLVSHYESSSKHEALDALDEKSILNLASHYKGESMYEMALDIAEHALSRFQYNSDFHIIKASILLELGIIDQCIVALDKAEKITPYEIDITLIRAKAICELGSDEDALAILEPLKDIVSQENLMKIYLTESYIYDAMGDSTMVIQRLRTVLNNNPLQDEALAMMWNALEMYRAYDLSIEIMDELLDLNPYNYMAWYILGQSYAAEMDYNQAIDAMEYSFIINSEYAKGYIDCAELCMDMCRYAQALSIYKEYIHKFGATAQILLEMAKCQYRLGDHTTAKLNLFKALKTEKSNDEIHFLLGECFSKDGNWYKAIDSYYRALDIDDCIEDYYLSLAKAFIQVEDYNKATINFQLASEIAPHCNKIWSTYISFLIKLGLYKESDRLLDEAFCYAFGADMLYCHAITSFYLDKQKKGLHLLEEALLENFKMHKMIFSLAPELEIDKDIMAMIKYFKGELSYQEAY